jgi:hypothetical protein
MNLYDKVAEHLSAHGLPIGAAAVREVEHCLKLERRSAAYDRAGLPIRPCQAVILEPHERLAFGGSGEVFIVPERGR